MAEVHAHSWFYWRGPRSCGNFISPSHDRENMKTIGGEPMNGDKAILGEYINQGFSLQKVEQRPDGAIFELFFKGASTKKRFSELWTTSEGIQESCRQFINQLTVKAEGEFMEIVQGRTLKKAIEILQLEKTGNFEGDAHDLDQAHQMGIEALERIQDMRGYRTLIGLASSMPGRLLPSEDKDD